ncbi:MAG: DUF1800 domain-containing protein [Thermomicrobiales bacterium]
MVMEERRRISHLLRRAGFGATPDELDRYVKLGFDATLDVLLHPEKVTERDLDGGFAALGLDATSPGGIQSRWLHRMVNTNRPLSEKIALFWHGHFATSIEKVKSTTIMWQQYELLRDHGLGTFHDLALGVAQDPAMLIWLDNAKSKAQAPNENFGREFLELFTLGVGNYTEADVKASSRAFTGWSLQFAQGVQGGDSGSQPDLATASAADQAATAKKRKSGKVDKTVGADPSQQAVIDAKQQAKADRRVRGADFLLRAKWHDDGAKTFLGETGPLDGDDIVRIVSGSPACAQFITRKLFSFFVWDKPDDKTLAPFVAAFTASGGDIRQTLSVIFQSPEFSSDLAYRAKVRGPVEYVVATCRQLGMTELKPGLAQGLQGMGQTLFAPPNVGGWPSGLGWIGPSALLNRYNLVLGLLGGSTAAKRKKGAASPYLSSLLQASSGQPSSKIVDSVVLQLLYGDLKQEEHDALAAYLDIDPKVAATPFSSDAEWAAAKLAGLVRLVAATPIYQRS